MTDWTDPEQQHGSHHINGVHGEHNDPGPSLLELLAAQVDAADTGADLTEPPPWFPADQQLYIQAGPAVETSARAMAASMGLDLAAVSPAAASKLRDQVWEWLQPAMPELTAAIAGALRPHVDAWLQQQAEQ